MSKKKSSKKKRKGISRRSLLAASGLVGFYAGHGVSSEESRRDRRKTYINNIKTQSSANYTKSLEEYGGRLSMDIGNLLQGRHRSGAATDFDVLIIGSGYGASICAARLSKRLKKGKRLGIIERGKEWIPGNFPDNLKGMRAESRFELLGKNAKKMTNPLGLLNQTQNEEVNVLSGNGLGGSSLINANVAIRPDREVFNIPEWPEALRNRSVLDPYYNLAGKELNIRATPWDATPKMRAQRMASKNLVRLGAKYEAANLAVTPDTTWLDGESKNQHGMIQRPCTNCGDCTTGCNAGAKNTLQMNYLPMARKNGAEIYTQTEVVTVQKYKDHYRVYVKHRVPHGDEFKTTYGVVSSRVVILGAGSLGSTEILLRSWARGLEFSQKLGWNWTGNGDALGFVTGSDHVTNIGGQGTYHGGAGNIGPTIQTNLTFPGRKSFRDRVLVQDGSISRAYANTLGLLMQDFDLDSTLVMLGMGHDGANGRVVLREGGHAEVKWPGIKDGAYRKFIRAHFDSIAKAHGGKYRYLKIYGDNFISVHPLGGCNMSDDPTYGVTNHKGQVFDGAQFGQKFRDENGAAVHSGLYVADGAIIPYSLGVNPLFTISALAERIAHHMVYEPEYKDLFEQRA